MDKDVRTKICVLEYLGGSELVSAISSKCIKSKVDRYVIFF